MLIQTNHDAQVALAQLTTDLNAAVAGLSSAQANQGWFSSLFNSGDQTTLVQQEDSVLQGLLTDVAGLQIDLDDSDTPLAPQWVQTMQDLQSTVIQARGLVNQTISLVDWSFGNALGDALTSVGNNASQAIASIGSGLGVAYKYIEIGAVIAGVVLIYALFLRVR